MHCPYCGHTESKVIDSRPTDEKKRRRRECMNCQKRFTTYEVVEMPLIMVEKRDGTYEQFNRNKLISGIFTAIKKTSRIYTAGGLNSRLHRKFMRK